ncbi:MAG: ATP-binding protein [Propionicimonas sp.]|uniref:sensor histidine kinase n=1 Tax=Propionicimonas sp. TaxID=1955623 RepID=UPI003D0E20F5
MVNLKPKTSQLSAWVDRGVALFCLGTLIPASLAAADQIQHLALWWMVVVGGGIVVASIGMMVASFQGWKLRSFALVYVTVVTFGLITWPAAWQSDQVAASSPWLWMCLGVAAICLAVTTGTGWGFAYSIASGLLFAAVRMTPSGQSASLLGAFQDMINLVMNASVVIVALGVVSTAFKELDEAEAATRKEATDAAIEEALLEERHRLDGIVHDEVMTTLVAAAHAPGDVHVAQQAQRAVDRLAQAEAPTETRLPVTGDQLTWLVTDVVSALVPQTKFVSQLEGLAVPQQVASTLGMVVREVALNVAKHSKADEVEVTMTSPDKGAISISIADNGVGFDPELVPKRRLGLQVSVGYRMWAIGGSAEIHSQPGQGTVVVLTWKPENSTVGEAELPRRRRAGRVLADIPDLSRPLLVRLVWVLVGLQFLLGWTSLDQVTMVWPVFLAQALAVGATWLTLRRTSDNPMRLPDAILVVVLLIAVTLIVQAVLPNGHWPGYATWHSGVVMVLLVTVLVRGQERVAWTGVGLYAVISAVWAITHEMTVADTLRVGFTPFSWMLVAQLLQSWLIDLADRMNASRRSSAAANKAIAQSFSKLVLRDVWLTQLRAQVGPLLNRIADTDYELSDEERAACLAQESRLRDAMRAGNLVTELTSDAIEVARGRGVDVRLVDSRGTRLPEDVRAALTQHLGRLLTDSSTKRVVARAAPEGYEDVVTVLAVRDDGSSELIGLDASGRVSTR